MLSLLPSVDNDLTIISNQLLSHNINHDRKEQHLCQMLERINVLRRCFQKFVKTNDLDDLNELVFEIGFVKHSLDYIREQHSDTDITNLDRCINTTILGLAIHLGLETNGLLIEDIHRNILYVYNQRK